MTDDDDKIRKEASRANDIDGMSQEQPSEQGEVEQVGEQQETNEPFFAETNQGFGIDFEAQEAFADKQQSSADENDLDSPVSSMPVTTEEKTDSFDASSVVDDFLKIDLEQLDQEQKELDTAYHEHTYWQLKSNTICDVLGQLQETFRAILDGILPVYQRLASAIPDSITNRYEGIMLCKKMLDRAVKRLSPLDLDAELPEAARLDPIQEQSVRERITGMEKQACEKAIKSLQREQRVGHGRHISEAQNRARAVEKQYLNFIERTLLPIIDGLDEGRRLSAKAGSELIEQHPEQAIDIEHWFGIYNELIKQFDETFAKIGLYPRMAMRGDDMDYEAFEPLDVEEDPALENEQVKEMLRRAYEFESTDGQARYIIRTGQVVVVRNA